jgi:anti-sigma B factor antagonist
VDVDLTGVAFMDSSGLGLLVDLRQWSEANSVRLRLLNVPRIVVRVLEYSGVTQLFEISAAQLEPD